MKNSQAKSECTKRVLKPVIEKKRRDRINQKLHELRILLLRCTQDKRLQNPKLEKAEILDLAVLYLRRDTENQSKRHDPLEQRSPAQDSKPVFMTTPQPSRGQFSPVYTAGFHQCLSNVSTYVTSIGSSEVEVDPEINKLRVCLDSHFSSPGSHDHRRGRHLPMSDGPTGGHHGPLPTSEQLTPPHSPSLSPPCSSPNHSSSSSSSSSSSPSPHPFPLPYDNPSPHSASLYSVDSHQLSLPSSSSSSSSSSPAVTLSSMSHLPAFQSPPTTRRRAVASPSSGATWRPWN